MFLGPMARLFLCSPRCLIDFDSFLFGHFPHVRQFDEIVVVRQFDSFIFLSFKLEILSIVEALLPPTDVGPVIAAQPSVSLAQYNIVAFQCPFNFHHFSHFQFLRHDFKDFHMCLIKLRPLIYALEKIHIYSLCGIKFYIEVRYYYKIQPLLIIVLNLD